MLKRNTTVLLIFIVSGLMIPSLLARDWTSKNGQKVQADFVKLEDGVVHIKTSDGKIGKIKLDSLSDADQNYVKLKTKQNSSPVPGNTQQSNADVLKKFKINGTSASVTDINGDITDADVAALAKAYPNLTEINFVKCDKITGSGLKGLTQLRSLLLQLCPNLTDDGLKSLKDLTQLESVMLTFSGGITDAGVENLSGLTKLKSLSLVGTSITDDGLKYFQNMKLNLLDLNQCEKVTLKAVENLRKAMPDCQIRYTADTEIWKKFTINKVRMSASVTDTNGDINITDEDVADLAKTYPNLTSINFSKCEKITGSGLENFNKLQRLYLNSCQKVTPKAVENLRKAMPNCQIYVSIQPTNADVLKKFTINGTSAYIGNDRGDINITDEDIVVLAKAYPNLTALVLHKCDKITGSGLENLTQLQRLYLPFCPDITDDGLKALKNLTQLEEVIISDCGGITDAGMENLKGLTKLKSLNLVGASITDDSLKYFRNMKNLKQLKLNQCEKVTPKAVEDLRKAMPNCQILYNVGQQPANQTSGLPGNNAQQPVDADILKKFTINGTSASPKGDVTDADIVALAKAYPNLTGLYSTRSGRITGSGLENLKELRILRLELCPNLTDAGLRSLKDLTQLEDLRITHCSGITDAGVEHLKGLTNLKHLQLVKTSITGDGLKSLKNLTQLEYLRIAYCSGITDAGVEHLKGLTNLKHLQLIEINITDDSLKLFKNMNLKTLTLIGCQKVSPKAIEDLRRAMPDCQIFPQMENTSADVLKKFKINNGTSASVVDDKGEINISDADIVALAKAYPDLTSINFIMCDKITGSGLKNLTKLQRLQLQLCYNLTDDGLKSLKNLTQLEDVMLTHCSGITDAGVEHLKGFTKLNQLQLVGTSITDDSLKYFKNMKLEMLNLNSCQKVTPKAVENLRKAMPNCQILYNVGNQP